MELAISDGTAMSMMDIDTLRKKGHVSEEACRRKRSLCGRHAIRILIERS